MFQRCHTVMVDDSLKVRCGLIIFAISRGRKNRATPDGGGTIAVILPPPIGRGIRRRRAGWAG